jgi:ankyrin repeat protein
MNLVSQRLYDAVWSFDPADKKAVAAIKAALGAGADPMAEDRNGRPIAFAAASAESPVPLKLMLEHGLDINVRGSDGTLLHRAAAFGRIDVIQFLLKRGLAVDVEDDEGRTPLDAARAWKHGADAVPLLTRLTKAALKKSGGRKAEPNGDLALADVKAALKKVKDKSVARAAGKLVDGFFATKNPRSTAAFLTEFARQDDAAMIDVGLTLAATATTAAPTTRKVDKLANPTIHIGDLEVTGAADAKILVVTGDLTVKGKLSNYEGAVIAVGGDVTADAIWSEGPFVVHGDVTVKRAAWAAYNDHAMRIAGTLKVPLLAVIDHVFSAKRVSGKRYDDIAKMSTAHRKAFVRALGPIRALTRP